MPEKLTFDYVKLRMQNVGYVLNETEYLNNRTKMKCTCPVGHVHFVSYADFKNGRRCVLCSKNKRLSKIDVEQIFLQNNCILLESNYINNKQKLKYKCSCGNISYTRLDNFKQGHRCNVCSKEKIKNKISGISHYNYNEDRDQIKLNKKINKLSKDLIRSCLKISNINKYSKSEEILGYNRKQLIEHLQKDPNFNNWKNDSYNWHIDHIFPKIAFINEGILDLSLINSLDNLRIISCKDNLSKGNKYNKIEFYEYLKYKNYNFL